MTLCETWLKPRMKFKIPGYHVVRSDRVNRMGGVAILVKVGLVFGEIEPIQSNVATLNEQLTIKVNTNDNESVFISTIYCPRGYPSVEILEGLLEGRERVVLTGDFNIRHTDYGHDITNKGGEVLHNMTTKHHLTLANDDTPTFISHNGTHNKLDLMFISPPIVSLFRDFWVGEDLGSDHFTIHAHITMAPSTEILQDKTIRLYHKANWTDINDSLTNTMSNTNLNPLYDTPQNIDSYVTTMSETISSLIEEKVPTKILKGNSIGLPIEIRELILKKRQARRRWQQTRLTQDKTEYNKLNKLIGKLINTTRRNSWQRYCNDMNLDEGQGDSWRKLRSVINPRTDSSIPALVSTNAQGAKTHAYTTQAKLDAFANKLTEIFTEEGDVTKYDEHWRQLNDNTLQNHHSLLPLMDEDITHLTSDMIPISPKELLMTIKRLKPKKAGGHDLITNKIISYMIPSLLPILHTIFNACLLRGYFPKSWKIALGMMIHKPNKSRSYPENYRPISLLCNLGKVLESIISRRVYDWADSAGILNDEQSGFRRNRSTNDKLYQLTQIIAQAKSRRRSGGTLWTGAVFLDIEKAFDRVWHNGLRRKLITLQMPAYLLRWISDFLRGRLLKVIYMGQKSRDVIINHGVPQGSPLSPILFLLYISDLPPVPNTVSRSLFADDLKIFTSYNNLKIVSKRLQTCLDELTEYAAKWRIGLNVSKTSSVLFNMVTRKKLGLKIHGEEIETMSFSQFLGIIFDYMLNFRKHFKSIAGLARYRIFQLKTISSYSYGPPTHVLIRLYKIYIRNLFEYGSAATCVAPQSSFDIWERLQARFIAQTLHLPYSTNHNTLRRLANISTVHDRVLYRATTWYRKSLASSAATRNFDEQFSVPFPDDRPRLTPFNLLNTLL